MTVGAEWH